MNFTAPALGRVPEIPMVESALPPNTLVQTSRIRECNPTLGLLSDVFEEEISDIAQVHSEGDSCEFDLADHPPLKNVEGNHRRKLKFWELIGTLKFILKVIERESYAAFSKCSGASILGCY